MEVFSFIVQFIRPVWRWLRMNLPFPNKKKVLWNIRDNLDRILYAIGEEDPQHFLQEIRLLYPRLEQYGIRMPLIDPVKVGESEFDSTWHSYHLTFLKCLHRYGRSKDFSLHQWNEDVDREADKRRRHLVAAPQPQARESGTWMDKADAFLLIRSSTLVPDIPNFNIPWTLSEGRKRVRTNHIVSGYLGDFEMECPECTEMVMT